MPTCTYTCFVAVRCCRWSYYSSLRFLNVVWKLQNLLLWSCQIKKWCLNFLLGLHGCDNYCFSNWSSAAFWPNITDQRVWVCTIIFSPEDPDSRLVNVLGNRLHYCVQSNPSRQPNVGLRRWRNIKPTLVERLVFTRWGLVKVSWSDHVLCECHGNRYGSCQKD